MPKCPRCGSDHVVKNGRIHNGKQNQRCRGCGRQFVEHPEQKRISEAAVLPREQHKAVGKEAELTNYVERFNNTARQRTSRLARKTLSFSEKLQNHIGALWYFVHHYNLSLLK